MSQKARCRSVFDGFLIVNSALWNFIQTIGKQMPTMLHKRNLIANALELKLSSNYDGLLVDDVQCAVVTTWELSVFTASITPMMSWVTGRTMQSGSAADAE